MKLPQEYVRTIVWKHNTRAGQVARVLSMLRSINLPKLDTATDSARCLALAIEADLIKLQTLLNARDDEAGMKAYRNSWRT